MLCRGLILKIPSADHQLVAGKFQNHLSAVSVAGSIRSAGGRVAAVSNLKLVASERAGWRLSRIRPDELTLDVDWTGPCVSFHTSCQGQDVSESESDNIQNSSQLVVKATTVPGVCEDLLILQYLT